jgi:hypothetical protein
MAIGAMAAIGLGAIADVVAIASNTFWLVRKAETVVVGKALLRENAPQLWGKVERHRSAARGPPT